MAEGTPRRLGWLQARWVLAAIVIAGLAIRLALLPSAGYPDDLDQFVEWVRHIADKGLRHAYDEPLSFGPVMAFAWWVIGLVDPSVAQAVDSADPALRTLLKLPAVVADLGIAALAWFALRHRPGLAAAAVAVLLLHPAIWLVSAWWGQYESVYTLFGVAAFVLAIRGHDRLAVVALVLAVMTKPQAAPLAVPFAAWFVARAGWGTPAGGARTPLLRLGVLAVIGLATIAVVWARFVAYDGPANYLAALADYQNGKFSVLSLRAWNPWWLVQLSLGHGNFVGDANALAGGLTFRAVGYIATGLGLLLVALCVIRRPTPRVLALALAAPTLVAFELLTTMHERYAFAALPMLVFLFDQGRVRWLTALFGTAFLLNLVWVAQEQLGLVLPSAEALSVAGTAINVLTLVVVVQELLVASGRPEPASVINDFALEASAASRRGTNAGSAAATSGA